jgi:hypothetical protein
MDCRLDGASQYLRKSYFVEIDRDDCLLFVGFVNKSQFVSLPQQQT